ncbi:MAG: caspase family protein [Alistipes sp.]|nr:caspase family protein [Alistipes sp.]
MKKFLYILLPLCLLFSVSAQAQTKHALVIGIGEYLDPEWGKINGDKDVAYVLEILKDAGYSDITTLVNKQATKQAIVNAFKRLESVCQSDDIVYIHYSGHGQQMSDRGNDERDHRDECWIPYDAYRKPSKNYSGEKHLVDDELNVLLTKIRRKVGDGGKILVVVDACHSGDITRGDGETVRGVMDIFVAAKEYVASVFDSSAKSSTHTEQWITISACQSYEVNIEMRSPSVGKLTYAIYTLVKGGNVGTNSEFYQQIFRFMDNNRGSLTQEPQMTGLKRNYNISDIIL